MKNIKKKNIVITGSSSGIGYYIAKSFSDLGSNVIINGKDKSKLINSCNTLGSNSSYVQSDLSTEKGIFNFSNNVLEKFNNKIDVLVCNLGSGKPSNDRKTYKSWLDSFNINFFSAVSVIENFKKALKKRKGNIICISSICGVETINGAPIPYSVAKNALNFYVKLYSRELSKINIRINVIAPGNILFDKSSWSQKLKKNKKKVENTLKERVPQNRFGSPSDISELAIYLSSSKANFITGSVFIADGGQTVSI